MRNSAWKPSSSATLLVLITLIVPLVSKEEITKGRRDDMDGSLCKNIIKGYYTGEHELGA
jgi:hypothetical protein